VTFYFIAKLFGRAATPYLESYGGDYFSFVLIGIAFSDYLGVGLTSFAGIIREGQMLGTLEAMLITPPPEFILLTSFLHSGSFF